MTTIIAQENFNTTEPASREEQIVTQDLLCKILNELQKLNIHMEIVTDEEITDEELENDND